MKPETAVLLSRAEQFLAKAPEMLRMGFSDEAARAAYMAGLNAARGLIFERTDTVAKTHGGTHSKFAELTRADTLDDDVRRFLGWAFDLKTSCDYGIGRISVITPDLAQAAIDTAIRLKAEIERMLPTIETKEIL